MRLRLLLLLLPLMLSAWEPYLEFQGRAGDFRKGGGVLMWAPVATNGQTLLFGQAAGGRFIDLYDGSVGAGLRHMVDGSLGAGINIFFDVARSNIDRTYLQGGVGLELFGPRWVARANGYVPNPNRFRISSVEAFLDNGTNDIFELTDTTVETALFGADAEVGFGTCHCGNEVWLYGGAYGYNGPTFPGFIGPRVRAEYIFRDVMGWWGAQVTVGGEYQWDHEHRSQGSAIVTVRLPLGRWQGRRPCLNICDRMRDPVRRQPAIGARSRRTVRQVRIPREPTGGPIWFVAEGAMGGGTQMDPASISFVRANQMPGDAIILLVEQAGMNTITVPDPEAPYPLLQGSSMAAFGALDQITLVVRGKPTKITKLDTSITERSIFTTGAVDLLTAAGMNEIFNFDMLNSDRQIISPAANGLIIRQMNLTTPTGDAIALTNANNVTIDTVTINNAPARGIVLAGATNVMINDVVFTMPGDTLLDITGGNGVRVTGLSNAMNALPANIDAVRFVGTGFTLSGANNVLLGGGGTGNGFNFTNASNVQLNGTMANPIMVSDFGTGVLFDGGTGLAMDFVPITNPGASGVMLSNSMGTVNVANSPVMTSGGDGMSINNATGTVTISGSPVTASTMNGFSITNSAADVSITGSNITTAAQGVSMAGNTGNVTIDSATIQTITNQGILANSLTGGTLTMSNLMIQNTGTGLQITKSDAGTATSEFTNSTINTAAEGMIVLASAGTLTANITNSTIENITGGGTAASFLCSGSGATMNNTFTGMTMQQISGQGLLLGSMGLAEFTQRVAITNSTFGGAALAMEIAEEAISVDVGGAVGTSTCDVSITGSQFHNVYPGGGAMEQAIALFPSGPAGANLTLTANISNNGFTAVGAQGIVGTWIGDAQANQTLNVTIAKNTWSPTNPAFSFVELLSDGPNGNGLICTDINGNSTGTTNPSIALGTTAAGAGTMNIVVPGIPLGPTTAALVAANVQARNTVVPGSVQALVGTPYVSVPSCPQPTPPQQ